MAACSSSCSCDERVIPLSIPSANVSKAAKKQSLNIFHALTIRVQSVNLPREVAYCSPLHSTIDDQ